MNIYGMSRLKLEEYFISIGEKKFKAVQIFEWIYDKKVTSFYEMSNLKKELLSYLDNELYYDFICQVLFFVILEKK